MGLVPKTFGKNRNWTLEFLRDVGEEGWLGLCVLIILKMLVLKLAY